VVIGNASTQITVHDSSFTDSGQSAGEMMRIVYIYTLSFTHIPTLWCTSSVLFVGNNSNQASDSSVVRNTITGVGALLSSAGGVVLTSASRVYIGQNNISRSARWGVAIRSNADAASNGNTVEGNRVTDTGLLTADFGAISLIDHTVPGNTRRGGTGNTMHSGGTGNTIRGNCVRNTLGMRDAGHWGRVGELRYPFWGRAVYLDDHSSNVLITGNVFRNSSHASVFVHSGSNNTMTNNVFEAPGDMSTLFKTITTVPGVMRSNRLECNAFVHFGKAATTDSLPPFLSDGGKLGSPLQTAITNVSHNLYYASGTNLTLQTSQLFMHFNWEQWKQHGYGDGSVLNEDPGFVDAAAGNWALKPESPLHGLGFQPLSGTAC
jgi:parallel beta-helix repeat protein